MSSLYRLVLAAVAFPVLAVVIEAVISVTRKPQWHVQRFAPAAATERPSQRLPLVGIDRRAQDADTPIADSVHADAEIADAVIADVVAAADFVDSLRRAA
jgi:hypothetical protein